MTCVNWSLSILAIVIFLFAVWPGFGSATTIQWVVGIAAVLILILAITGVECKPCMNRKKKKK